MPSASITFLANPLQFTNSVFEKLVIQEGKGIHDVLKFVIGACEQEILAGGIKLLQELPLLTEDNVASLPHGSLVRYRCVIQDMRQPEYFLSVYATNNRTKPNVEQLHCNLWQEAFHIPDGHDYCEENDRCETSERHVYVGSSNPAVTEWVRHYFGDKRVSSSAEARSWNLGHNLSSGQCLVKVYHDRELIKLNDIIEFIGIYYSSDALEEIQGHEEAISASLSDITLNVEANGTKSANRVLLPTVHAFKFDKLRHYHPEPGLPYKSGDEAQIRSSLMRALHGDVPSFRGQLVDLFKDYVFNGDELAAEYFLCHLMSSVFVRQGSMAVGQFTLNIFNVPTISCGFDWVLHYLRPVLDRFLAQVAYLPLTLSNLNRTSFVSRKCYDTDRLISGCLQLPNGTELLLDEMKLEAGQLDTQGVKNVAALRTMIKFQKLDYDFIYNTCEFSTDVRTLIISEGPSILPSDFALPLANGDNANRWTNPMPAPFEDSDFLEAARIYFALAPLLTFTIDSTMQKRIEEDFVVMRHENAAGINGDYLHRLLTLARLLGISHGDSFLRMEIWEKAKRLESERLKLLETKQKP